MSGLRQLILIQAIPANARVINTGKRRCSSLNLTSQTRYVLADFTPQRTRDPVVCIIYHSCSGAPPPCQPFNEGCELPSGMHGGLSAATGECLDPARSNNIIPSIPADVRTVLSALELDPKVYAHGLLSSMFSNIHHR
jgi:hypothetical protein